jgi:serine/threonine protein kinase
LEDNSKQPKRFDDLSRSAEPILVSSEGGDEPIEFERPTHLTDIVSGTILSERYEIVEFLGKGGMGSVYKARHTLIGNIVAIKILHTHLINDDASRERFKAEARAAISLRHQRLMSVSDYGVAPSGQPYIVMEYVDGISLADLLTQRKYLESNEFFDLFEQVCEGLAHAHAKGVVHRDIKPSNIMLSNVSENKPNVHIVDFGIAKVLPRGETPVQHLTQTGEIFGSPLYMSPEQCKGRAVDARSDIYSLGCVMFEALTGNPPHIGESAIETLMLHVNEKAPKISARRSGIADVSELEQIVAKALATDPDSRYQDLNQLKTDIGSRKFLVSPKGANANLPSKTPTEQPALGQAENASFFQKMQKSGWSNPLIMICSALVTVWVVCSFNIKQPPVAILGGVKEQQLHEAELEFQLAEEKSSRGFTSEAAEYSQRALDLRSHLAKNTLMLAESLDQRADIAIHDAEHQTILLEEARNAPDVEKEERNKKITADYWLAEKLLREAILVADANTTGVEKAGSPVHFRNNLATVYLDQGRYAEAEKILNELSELFLTHQSLEKSDDPHTVEKAFHDLFDQQYERVYWGSGRELEAAKLRLAHHRPDEKVNQPLQAQSPAPLPFSGRWTDGSFTINLSQEGSKIIGLPWNRFVADDLAFIEEPNNITGTVNDSVAHLVYTHAAGRKTVASAVRLGNVLVFHVQKANPNVDTGYIPNDAILDFAPNQAEQGTSKEMHWLLPKESPAPEPAPEKIESSKSMVEG